MRSLGPFRVQITDEYGTETRYYPDLLMAVEDWLLDDGSIADDMLTIESFEAWSNE